ncbi:MAG: DNA gyrase subunit A [Fimbriimonadaceae bacterium]|nr:DNA gyrase subunit A [Fimbriimonadaceae bacterium]
MSDDLTPSDLPVGGSIRSISLTEEMSASYMDYAMSTIVSRALPDVRDGLKPVQRRILQAMADLNLRSNRPTLKCAKIAGQTSGDYHPHGEQNVYPAMVRMAQDFSLRYMLVQGQGNFGSVDGDPPAAMRYTEARLSPLAEAMLEDIEKNTVDFQANYDERVQEPRVLPGKFPNLLCNGNEGIAVGMACKLAPHNLREVAAGICAYIENPDITVEELMEFIPGPDFPTRGMVLGRQGIIDAYTTGRGSVTMQGRAAFEPCEGNRTAIIITELPYQVNKARFQEKVADLVRHGKLANIAAIRDESDRNGMRVVIELKREANPEVVLNQLYKRTELRQNFPIYNLALVDGRPQLLSLKDLVAQFVRHREEVVTRRTKFLLKQAEERAHLLEGMLKALDIIDQIIQCIRASAHRTEARQNLQERFDFSPRQANAIVEMTLGQLTGLERQKLQDEYDQLQKDIGYYRELLADRRKRLGVVQDETKEIADKFGDDRRTQLRKQEAVDLRVEDLIAEEDMVITITRDGYAKRIPIETYRVQQRGGRGLLALTKKEEDAVEHIFVATTHHYLLFFTNRGRVHQIRAFEIPQASRTARGLPVINLINIEPGEYVTATIPVRGLQTDGFLTMVTGQGTIKKTPMSDFANINRMGLIAIGLVDDDELGWVIPTSGADELVIATQQGMSIRFSEDDVRPMGRPAQGVRGVKLRDGDAVVGVVKLEEGKDIFVCGTRGLGKRTPVKDEEGDIYRLQTRGGIGIITYRVNDKTGEVAGLVNVDDGDELMILTANGVLIRIPCKKISRTGRAAQGVKLINLDDGDAVARVAKVVRMVSAGSLHDRPAEDELADDLDDSADLEADDDEQPSLFEE